MWWTRRPALVMETAIKIKSVLREIATGSAPMVIRVIIANNVRDLTSSALPAPVVAQTPVTLTTETAERKVYARKTETVELDTAVILPTRVNFYPLNQEASEQEE